MATNHSKYIDSTSTHYISNSGKDENNAYTGGKAGDQSGHEWELKSWYNRPWTVVLRFLDQAVALTIAKLGIEAALNNLIGYDQNQRNTYWTQLKAAGYDPSRITVACEEDCTAGVSANVKAAGFIHGIKALQDVSICSSRNMKSVFTKAGFVALTDSKYLTSSKYLLPGDILLYENHHAATNITVGSAVRSSWKPGMASAPVASDAEKQVQQVQQVQQEKPEGPYISITGSVNVRKGPAITYPILGVARRGDQLHYFGFTFPNGWFLVEYNGQLAAVSGLYGKVTS